MKLKGKMKVKKNIMKRLKIQKRDDPTKKNDLF